MLTGWDIDILTEEEESERRQKEFIARSERFIEALDVDEVIAHLLVTEGFSSVEEVAYVPVDDVAGIEGFDEELAGQLQQRARNFLDAESTRLEEQRRTLGVTDELAGLNGLSPEMLIKLGENDVKTMEDFADLASDELTDPAEGFFASFEMREPEANELIMSARVAAGWFTEEELRAAELEKLAAEEESAGSCRRAKRNHGGLSQGSPLWQQTQLLDKTGHDGEALKEVDSHRRCIFFQRHQTEGRTAAIRHRSGQFSRPGPVGTAAGKRNLVERGPN